MKFYFLIRELASFLRNSWKEIVGSLLICPQDIYKKTKKKKKKQNKQAKNTCKMYAKRMLKYISTPTFCCFSFNSAGDLSLLR